MYEVDVLRLTITILLPKYIHKADLEMFAIKGIVVAILSVLVWNYFNSQTRAPQRAKLDESYDYLVGEFRAEILTT